MYKIIFNEMLVVYRTTSSLLTEVMYIFVAIKYAISCQVSSS
jgi:hypothetical protein